MEPGCDWCRSLDVTHRRDRKSGGHDDTETRNVCHGAIERMDHLDGPALDAILDDSPITNISNRPFLHRKLKGYWTAYQSEMLSYFGCQLKILVDRCGGLDVIKSYSDDNDTTAFRNLVMSLFDDLPLAICHAAFRLGNNAIDYKGIWSIETEKAMTYGRMYRLKFELLAMAP